jgi:hypothetical protein
VSYSSSAGNADTVDSIHASQFVRNDTTGQYLRAYYQYGSYLTSESPLDLVNQGLAGGGLRVDFMYPSYTGNGNWNHVITWSGYNGYNMYQLGGNYDGGTGTQLWVRSEANHGRTSWTSWRRLLDTSSDSYAANMNQYVRTTDSPSFAEAIFGTTGGATNQGIQIRYQNYGSGYGRIRFYQSDSNHMTIHAFSSSWQGGGFGTSNSAGAINIEGQNGVTFGGWNYVDAYIATGGNAWFRGDVTAYSDARVKSDVIEIKDALSKVNSIRGVTFFRSDKNDNKRYAGVIAQEVLNVLPEVVTEDINGHYSVAYGNLTSLLIEAIKEQQKQIEELQNKLDNVLSSR